MNTTAIRLLKAIIAGTTTPKSLMEYVGIKEWQFNEQIKKLHQDWLIKKDDSEIKLQENVKTALLLEITKKWDIERILRGSNELVFSYLTEPLTVNDIVKNTGLSLATVYRSISDLESIGVIKRESDGNAQNRITFDRFMIDSSKTPLPEYAIILKTEREKLYQQDAEIIYKDETRALKKVLKQKVTDGELTAFSLFTDYGIQYDAPFDYYIKQEKLLDIHDVIIHAVLAAYKAEDKLALLMSVIFYTANKEKTDILTLRKLASSFEISEIWLDIEGYIRRAEIKNKELFLPWDEFLTKARLYEINPEKYTLPKTAPLFEEIGKYLTKPMRVFLIGGENMRMKNLKATTKDCDLVVENKIEYELLSDILVNKLGYKPIIKTEYSQEDLRIHPDGILVHENRSRVDLFTKRVMREMSLTNNMIDTTDYVTFGKLQVGLLRNEYVFLFKAVAVREGDIQDMAKLVQGGLQPRQFQHGSFDWKKVWEEILEQEKMNPIKSLTINIFDQISLLSEQTGIIPPIQERLRRYVIDLLILQIIRGGRQLLKKIVTLLMGGDISEQMIRNRVDALARENRLKKQEIDGDVHVIPIGIPSFPLGNWEPTSDNLEIYLKWRFPMRASSSISEIKMFTEQLMNFGFNSIGVIDKIVIEQLDSLIEYEAGYFQSQPLKQVGAVRACIGLSNPKLGNNTSSPFYIVNFDKFAELKKKFMQR